MSFRKKVLEFCNEFDLPHPKNVQDLMQLCECILFQGQLEFTDESILDLKIECKIDDEITLSLQRDGEELE